MRGAALGLKLYAMQTRRGENLKFVLPAGLAASDLHAAARAYKFIFSCVWLVHSMRAHAMRIDATMRARTRRTRAYIHTNL
jgi:hypothetical protein